MKMCVVFLVLSLSLSLFPSSLFASASGPVLALALCQSGSSNNFLPIGVPIRYDYSYGWYVNGAPFPLNTPVSDFMVMPVSAVRTDDPNTVYYFLPSSPSSSSPPQIVTLTYTGSTFRVANTATLKSTNSSVSLPYSLAWMVYNPSLKVLMAMGFPQFAHIDPVTGAYTPLKSLYPSFSSSGNSGTYDPLNNVLYVQVGNGNGAYQNLCGYPDFKSCIAVLDPSDGSIVNVYQHQITSFWMSSYLYSFSTSSNPQAGGVSAFPNPLTTVEYLINGSVATMSPFSPPVSYYTPAAFDLLDTQYGMLYYINGGTQQSSSKTSYKVDLKSGQVVEQLAVKPVSLDFYCASDSYFMTGPIDVLTSGKSERV